MNDRISIVDPAAIQAAPFRSTVPSEKARAALRRSIERRGILQPLHLRRVEESAHKYEIIDGHCRWEVAIELGIQVPSYIYETMTLEEAKVMAQELNLLGAELNHINVAKLFAANAKFIGYDRMAELTSWPTTTVKSYVEMADYDWEHHVHKVRASRRQSFFGPADGDDDGNGESYWRR